jgi:lipopolysaccharide/colanic/teichoic acid biosynthesis glycosyltransferase
MIDSFERRFMPGLVRMTSGIVFEDSTLELVAPSDWSNSRSKRMFDLGAAALALGVFSVPIAMLAIFIRLSSKGDVFFIQERLGKDGRPFRIYKFRTMVSDQERGAVHLTPKGDARITPVGRLLRRFKFDELPQVLNVLRGDMSIVGPRPKLAKYAETDQMTCRPGLTGAATLAFRGEENILSGFTDPKEMEDFYLQYIMPLKSRLDTSYSSIATLGSDLGMIVSTVRACAGLRPESSLLRSLRRVQYERLISASISAKNLDFASYSEQSSVSGD